MFGSNLMVNLFYLMLNLVKNNFDWKETWNKYEYPKAYRRQLEMYQWLFVKMVSKYLTQHI